jgi:hypothetical protein
MPEFKHDEATAQRARDVIDRLLSVRDRIAGTEEGIAFVRGQGAVVPAAWSWWMFVTDSARVVRDETGKGHGFVVAPVMRNLMTHTVALAWLVDGGEEALKAVDAYSDGQLLKLITNAQDEGWDVEGDEAEARVREAISDRSAYPDPAVEKLTNEIANTATLMAAFGEQAAYLPYRHLSSYCHTTRETAQLYLSDGGDTWQLRSRPRPSGWNDTIWAAVCLIQAGKVIDSLLAGNPLAGTLDAAVAHLGVPDHIVPRRRTRRSRGGT